jgi:hypothetical protein
MLVEVLKPNKTDVLAYLNGLSGPPARWARAAVARVEVTQSLIVNYMVIFIISSRTEMLLRCFEDWAITTEWRHTSDATKFLL